MVCFVNKIGEWTKKSPIFVHTTVFESEKLVFGNFFSNIAIFLFSFLKQVLLGLTFVYELFE